jgi:hypothetical protein
MPLILSALARRRLPSWKDGLRPRLGKPRRGCLEFSLIFEHVRDILQEDRQDDSNVSGLLQALVIGQVMQSNA